MLADIALIVGIIATALAGAAGIVKLVVGQYHRALTEKLESMERARSDAAHQLNDTMDSRFAHIERTNGMSEDRFKRLEEINVKVERDLLEFKLDVSENRTHRDDFVRNMTLIEAKLDGMANKMENWFLRMRHDPRD